MSGEGAETTDRDGLIIGERFELLVALILAITVVAMAWSAFQSAKWGSAMTVAFNEAAADRTVAATDIAQASRDLSGDRSTFGAFVLALSAGDEIAARILFTEFRDEVQPLIEEWLAQDPLSNPDMGSPFDVPGYSVHGTLDQAVASLEAAEALTDGAMAARDNAANYTLTTVLFAVVLFLAGLSGQIKSRRVSLVLVGLGGVLLVIGATTFIALPTLL